MGLDYSKEDFGPEFKWGVSASSFQTEGASDADGKGKSIWDVFSHTRGKIYQSQKADVACDFYHRYPGDLDLMARMQIPAFRFSLSWSRILPDGTTRHINNSGIDFYHRLIDQCLAKGIEPWITLYHWDLPQALEERGGWTNRDVIGWFGDYVELCIRQFGRKVRRWMILNEPMVFTGTGYFLGLHAPGRRGLNSFLAAIHHAAMCQAEGGRIVRSMSPDALVGTTFSCSYIEANTHREADLRAARRVDALLNRLFVEPLAGLGYPIADLKFLRRLEPFIKDGDEARLAFSMDFIGIQNYTREIVTHAFYIPFMQARIIRAAKRKAEITQMNWEVYPQGIYHMLHKFNQYHNFKELIVTENGAAFDDELKDGRVDDPKRKAFLETAIGQVLKARQEGVRVNGYFIWSFTDNFEWAEGYRPRFGLVYIDYVTQQRIVKESGRWYSRFLGNGSIDV
ncbi:MAG: beta-glucosidase [Bacteroidales bacterium]|jgi:beta-glucosidase|nr:beta-glucosidase [Bacteroidales bacterium]